MEKYDKLVRDKIPSIIENNNETPIIEILKDEEYFNQLNIKLIEELNEYYVDHNIEELADLVEVIYAILNYKKVPLFEFEKIRLDKANKRGTFEKRFLLKNVVKND